MRNYIKFWYAVDKFHFDNGSFQFDSYALAFAGTLEELESEFAQEDANLQPNYTRTNSEPQKGYSILDKDHFLYYFAFWASQQVQSGTGELTATWGQIIQAESPRKTWSNGK